MENKEKTILEGKGLKIGYDGKIVVPGLDVKIPRGKITALIGPNGCGKSTLLKALARVLSIESGEVLLEGKNIFQTPTKEVAKQMALLPQAPQAPAGLSVEELVSYGRYPYQKGFGALDSTDHALIDEIGRAHV